MEKEKILIIGGTGFIGYHLASKCIKFNWDVTSVSTKKPTNERRLKKVRYKMTGLSDLHCYCFGHILWVFHYIFVEKNRTKNAAIFEIKKSHHIYYFNLITKKNSRI